MKVLFISSGNNKIDISPIIKNQGESLRELDIDIDYFAIKGRGAKGYFKSIFKIKKHLKNNSYDIVHAHFWLSAMATSLAGAKPLVVSLMGDDVKKKSWYKWIIYIFYLLSWSKIIVKSKDMYSSLGLKSAFIIPNGIDMNKFKSIDKSLAIKKVGWDSNKRHILFTSDPKRIEKNFKLAKKAFESIDDKNVELHYLKDVPNEQVFYYYNASNVVILTSLWEGSPNAIKEAMACNVPIVATDVGDIRDVISNTKGCFVSSFDYQDIASNLKKALAYEGKTTGREDIKHLKSELIAKRIKEIYTSIKGI
jgi:glycosyltransferase involved in cell wall biosynthesis